MKQIKQVQGNTAQHAVKSARPQFPQFRLNLVALSVYVAFIGNNTGYAQDILPTAPQVVSGAASVTQSGTAQTINQTTDKAIINWGSFSVGSGSSVNFIQPGSGSVILNRVTGGDPSSILGSMSANGHVFLVNPNGIFFGLGSTVDTAGLVATTMSISDSDFLGGHYSFERNSAASIENAGVITIRDGGYALLAADKVSNGATGQINATNGNIGLVSADRVTIETQSDGLVGFSVEGNALRQIATVENAGVLT
ncbi:MAG TPA: filamentous hemagglutinin N-terminal domain-containing protein, partial [Methyloradius sp.]